MDKNKIHYYIIGYGVGLFLVYIINHLPLLMQLVFAMLWWLVWGEIYKFYFEKNGD